MFRWLLLSLTIHSRRDESIALGSGFIDLTTIGVICYINNLSMIHLSNSFQTLDNPHSCLIVIHEANRVLRRITSRMGMKKPLVKCGQFGAYSGLLQPYVIGFVVALHIANISLFSICNTKRLIIFCFSIIYHKYCLQPQDLIFQDIQLCLKGSSCLF